MLCPELPGGVLGTGTEDANGVTPECRIELVHRSPGPFPLLPVQLAPQRRFSKEGFESFEKRWRGEHGSVHHGVLVDTAVIEVQRWAYRSVPGLVPFQGSESLVNLSESGRSPSQDRRVAGWFRASTP